MCPTWSYVPLFPDPNSLSQASSKAITPVVFLEMFLLSSFSGPYNV